MEFWLFILLFLLITTLFFVFGHHIHQIYYQFGNNLNIVNFLLSNISIQQIQVLIEIYICEAIIILLFLFAFIGGIVLDYICHYFDNAIIELGKLIYKLSISLINIVNGAAFIVGKDFVSLV
jgi:hypothetical protein